MNLDGKFSVPAAVFHGGFVHGDPLELLPNNLAHTKSDRGHCACQVDGSLSREAGLSDRAGHRISSMPFPLIFRLLCALLSRPVLSARPAFFSSLFRLPGHSSLFLFPLFSSFLSILSSVDMEWKIEQL